MNFAPTWPPPQQAQDGSSQVHGPGGKGLTFYSFWIQFVGWFGSVKFVIQSFVRSLFRNNMATHIYIYINIHLVYRGRRKRLRLQALSSSASPLPRRLDLRSSMHRKQLFSHAGIALSTVLLNNCSNEACSLTSNVVKHEELSSSMQLLRDSVRLRGQLGGSKK